MFTIKLYDDEGRQVIKAADSFTLLRFPLGAEITLHRKSGDDERYDVGPLIGLDGPAGTPEYPFRMAIIENHFGKTTEIIGQIGGPRYRPQAA